MNDINFCDLLPDELNDLILKLKDVLCIVENKKNTNSRVISSISKIKVCPACSSNHVVKNGHDKNKVQCYLCKSCGRKFSASSNSLVYHSKLTYNKLLTFFECFNNKATIRKTANLMEVNKNTVFLLRHKVLESLAEIRENLKLKGQTESDEYYESINLKGTKKNKMPRFSKPRSSNGNSKRGISNHQVCIASAIDEFDICFFEIVGTGPITSESVEKVFKRKIDNVTTFITDCKSSYEKFINKKKIRLEQVKSGTYKNYNGYNLATINSLHSELSSFLSSFKGVSTKHLQHYLDWFTFQKLLNYTVEAIKQPVEMLNKSIVKKNPINSFNVYDNNSGIDFKDVYSDYAALSPTI